MHCISGGDFEFLKDRESVALGVRAAPGARTRWGAWPPTVHKNIRGPKPYKLKWSGDLHGPKSYKLIGFGDIHGPKPYKLIGDLHGPKPHRGW